MGTKSEARLTSSLLARKGSAQPFPAADVFSLPPQTVVNPDAGMDEQAVGRRPHPEGWSSSPVTPPASQTANQKTEALDEPRRAPRSWSTQSIFSALQKTPELHPAADQADDTGTPETPRKVRRAPDRDEALGDEPDASSAKDRVALTLRVDQARHTRLRVLAAQTRRSSQEILLAALDNYIDTASQGMGFCDCLKPNSQCCKGSASE